MRRELQPDEERDQDVARLATDEDEEAERDEEAVRRERARVRFERVAAGMERMLAPSPTLRIEGGVSPGEERGLAELYAAARGEEAGQPMSALARMAKLDEALAMLRPALVAGLDPALPDLRKRYEQLAEKVAELRHRITQRIGVEAVVFSAAAKKDDADDEDDEDDEDDDESGASRGPEAGTSRDGDA